MVSHLIERKVVLCEQTDALLDHMESHPDLALGNCSRTSEGRSLAKRQWKQLAITLNAVSPAGANKSPEEWRSYWNEFKCRSLKKIKQNKRGSLATDRPAKRTSLTMQQQRIYKILEREVGEPSADDRHSPPADLKPSNSSSNTPTQPSHQPSIHRSPRRRLQSPSQHQLAQDISALKEAEARLMQLEESSASAILQQADAIRELAAAVREAVGVMRPFIQPPDKKCRRRRSSDSESD